jgi:hypothetical protein
MRSLTAEATRRSATFNTTDAATPTTPDGDGPIDDSPAAGRACRHSTRRARTIGCTQQRLWTVVQNGMERWRPRETEGGRPGAGGRDDGHARARTPGSGMDQRTTRTRRGPRHSRRECRWTYGPTARTNRGNGAGTQEQRSGRRHAGIQRRGRGGAEAAIGNVASRSHSWAGNGRGEEEQGSSGRHARIHHCKCNRAEAATGNGTTPSHGWARSGCGAHEE